MSEIRYERKFIIAKDEALYREFVKFNADFERYVDEALAMAEPHTAAIFKQVKEAHRRYQELFSKEIAQLKIRQNYPQAWYQTEKGKAADSILEAGQAV